jgi:hypothetical protein
MELKKATKIRVFTTKIWVLTGEIDFNACVNHVSSMYHPLWNSIFATWLTHGWHMVYPVAREIKVSASGSTPKMMRNFAATHSNNST